MKKTHNLILAFVLAIASLQANATGNEPALDDERVQALLAPYIQLQEALAADNLGLAKVAAGNLVSVIPAGHLTEVVSALQTIAGSEDLRTARVPFKTVSDALIALVREHIVAQESGLYLAYCPMAFSNTGAYWIQDDRTVNNPYYGAMMLRCGMIRETLVEGTASGEVDTHGDHTH
jgi:Cu(I)/Ag(I) efflux system membrane fusion protein